MRAISAALACSALAMMVGTGVGDASDQPAVTGHASGVTSSLAQLNGTVYPNGLDSFWAFQYGTSAGNYSSYTAPVGPLSGTAPVSVATVVRGLQPQTTYHFRLIAIQGEGGTSGQPQGYMGADGSFTTTGSSPAPTTPGQRHAWASMRGRHVTVRGGVAIMIWHCSGTPGTVCKGKVTLWTEPRLAGRLEIVSCGAAQIKIRSGQQAKVRAHLSSRCVALLKASPGHRLGASLHASFNSGRGTAAAALVLVLRRPHR